ncbi:MAG: biotin synthase BioB, partial [Lentisphaeria bacterium]
AKSGVCKENCRFCAQSAHHSTNVEVYNLLESESILEQARKAYESGVSHYGIVTSGTGFKHSDRDFQEILKTIDLLYTELPEMKFCVSLGLLDEEACRQLAEHKVAHYNINLQVTPDRFKDLISTTHDIEEKIQTIKYLQKYGIQICCGGIIGLGETREDRVSLAFALKDLEVDVIPLNILVPIAGTPLENQPIISAAEAAKAFAVTRLINPHKIIKFAAGRETVMKDFMGLLMLSGANGLLTGGYLTTRGRDTVTDNNFMAQLEAF